MEDIFTKLARCHSAEEVKRLLDGNGAEIVKIGFFEARSLAGDRVDPATGKIYNINDR